MGGRRRLVCVVYVSERETRRGRMGGEAGEREMGGEIEREERRE